MPSEHDTTIIVAAANLLRERALDLLGLGPDATPLSDQEMEEMIRDAQQRVQAIVACRDAANAIDRALAELAAEALT